MKTTKILTVTLLMLIALFNTSCKKDIETNDDPQQVEQSDLVRSVVTSFQNGPSHNPSNTQTQNALATYLCFEFNYPISILYNDGTTQSLADDNEFAQAITDQTNGHYIIDFVYPFDITFDTGVVQTINDATDFESAVNDCSVYGLIDLPAPTQSYCFDFVYPVTLVYNDGSTLVVNSYQEFDTAIVQGTASHYVENLEYPFDVVNNGQTETITNSVEFQTLIDSCHGSVVSAILPPSSLFSGCMEIGYPVDLLYNDGTTVTVNNNTEYDAALDGSTPQLYIEDFVYDFDVLQNGNVYTIHDLGEFYDTLALCYVGQSFDFTDLLCFDFVYPLSVVYDNGTTQVIHNDTELNALFNFANPQQQSYDFVYPFDVVQNGNTITINDLNEFAQLLDSCTNP